MLVTKFFFQKAVVILSRSDFFELIPKQMALKLKERDLIHQFRLFFFFFCQHFFKILGNFLSIFQKRRHEKRNIKCVKVFVEMACSKMGSKREIRLHDSEAKFTTTLHLIV